MTISMALSTIASKQTKASEKTLEKMCTIIGLPGGALGHKKIILHFGHGDEHSLRCLIFVRSKSLQLYMQPCFHGMAS
jgi:hypothetical protein